LGTVDILHVDLYDHEAAAPVLDDVAFYKNYDSKKRWLAFIFRVTH